MASMDPIHPAMGPHYRVPRNPEEEPLDNDQVPPPIGQGKKGTWLVIAVVLLSIVALALAAVVL